MSMNFDFETAEKVEKANSRVNYDLRFSAKTRKFNFSTPAYNRLDINNNGLNMIKDAEGNVALTVQPNEESTIHRGRADASKKGEVFTADGLASLLGLTDIPEDGEDANFKLEEVEHDGEVYYIPVRMDEETPESITNTLDEVEEETEEVEEGILAGSGEKEDSGW